MQKRKCFSSRLTFVFAQSTEARCCVENADVVGSAPTGDAPTTSEWSTRLLITKVHLILEVRPYIDNWMLYLHGKAGPIRCSGWNIPEGQFYSCWCPDASLELLSPSGRHLNVLTLVRRIVSLDWGIYTPVLIGSYVNCFPHTKARFGASIQ